MTGLPLEDLRSIKVRIAVAGGLDKVAAILACLRGGHATVLVTDAATARGILKADGAPHVFDRYGPVSISNEQGGLVVKTKKLINGPEGHHRGRCWRASWRLIRGT